MARALVVGSVALDSIETPHGNMKNAQGGSASYASVAASYFTDVSLVAVVGRDFPESAMDNFRRRKIEMGGLEVQDGNTFHWSGYYERDMNRAVTLTTELNVFANFKPRLNDDHATIPYVFLANIHPELQLDVLRQIRQRKLVVMDTMNFWIEGHKQVLTQVMRECDIILLNEGEARQYCEKVNLIECGRELLELGPKVVVIKKGEHGAALFQKGRIHFIPAFPTDKVKDPTGAGDTFAGALVGFLAKTDDLSHENLVRAVLVGTVMASFVVEDFSLRRLMSIAPGEAYDRAVKLAGMVALPDIDKSLLDDAKS